MIPMDFHRAKYGKPPKYSKYISSESRGNTSPNRSSRRPRDMNTRSQMHDATCAECGESCQIPFEPRQGRPVLCSDCFRKTKPRDDRYQRDDRRPRDDRYQRDGRRPRDSTEQRQMYDATCAKCGNSCQIPFEPRQGRDVLCSDCFRTTKPRDNRRTSSRAPRRDRRERTRDDSFRKKKDYFEGGSDSFYANLREKLFEILGEKKCASCGFSDERALGFSDVDDKDAFDNIRRGGSASWRTYISEPDLARKKLQVLCLNCNQTK